MAEFLFRFFFLKKYIFRYELTLNGIAKERLTRQQIWSLANNQNDLVFRDGAKELFHYCYKENVPFLIVSGGIAG